MRPRAASAPPPHPPPPCVCCMRLPMNMWGSYRSFVNKWGSVIELAERVDSVFWCTFRSGARRTLAAADLNNADCICGLVSVLRGRCRETPHQQGRGSDAVTITTGDSRGRAGEEEAGGPKEHSGQQQPVQTQQGPPLAGGGGKLPRLFGRLGATMAEEQPQAGRRSAEESNVERGWVKNYF